MMVAIISAAITSTIVTKILATYYFRIVDGYVEDICKRTKKLNEETLATVCKLKQSVDPKA